MYANAMHEMTWYEMHKNENNTRRQDSNPRNKYNLAPETARVGYKKWKVYLGRYSKGHEISTGSGHHCGVITYSSVWCVDCLRGW